MTLLEEKLAAALRRCVEAIETCGESGELHWMDMPTPALEEAREALEAFVAEQDLKQTPDATEERKR